MNTIYLLSPRSGGPYKQLALVARKLNEHGLTAVHCYRFKDWVKLHFNRRDTIVSVIPFLFAANKNNLIMNIRGNYRRERRLTNPLSYLYDYNLRLARKTIVPSHYLKQELRLSDAIVIPTSTDVRPSSPSPAQHGTQPITLATITNFDFRPKAQGISKLINIVNQLETKQPIAVNIYGGGQYLAHAQQQFELHNYKKFPVHFHGKFTDAAEVLAGNDIFIYWSTFDNMPNVLIEATAAGLPVVVNRYAAYAEIVGEDNLLAKNETEFAALLLKLIESPQLRHSISQKNQQRAALFDINKNIHQWVTAVSS